MPARLPRFSVLECVRLCLGVLRTPYWCSMPKFPEEMCSPAQSPMLHTDPAAWLWGV